MVNRCNDFERALLMNKSYDGVVSYNESNWVKFLMQELEGVMSVHRLICSTTKLMSILDCIVCQIFYYKIKHASKIIFIFSHVVEILSYTLCSPLFSSTCRSCF